MTISESTAGGMHAAVAAFDIDEPDVPTVVALRRARSGLEPGRSAALLPADSGDGAVLACTPTQRRLAMGRPFTFFSITVFLLVALAHAIRIWFVIPVTLAGEPVPLLRGEEQEPRPLLIQDCPPTGETHSAIASRDSARAPVT